jgi:extracellular elastinolytic metalloproteinase
MRSQRGFVLACALIGTLVLAGSAAADTDIQGNPNGLPDLDVRAGKLAPTAAQRTDVRDLGAQVAWNQFGTPSSLVRSGGALGSAVQGSSASDAARAWLSSNRSLFRLSSTQGLALVSDNALAGGATHAVTLRQTIDGLAASGGGMVTIGVTKAGSAWKAVSASGTLNGDRTLDGKTRLRDGQAWQAAAASVGRVKSLAQIARLRGKKALGHGRKGLRVAGLGDVQQAREVASSPRVTRTATRPAPT